MQSLYKAVVEEYRKELSEILAENDKRVSRIKRKEVLPVAISTGLVRIVIPSIKPEARANFFVYTETNIRTEDDPILRFIPYMPGTKGYADLIDFKGTELVGRPYGIDEEIMERMLRSALTADRLQMGAEESGGSAVVDAVARFMGIDPGVVQEAARPYMKQPDRDATMKSLFCNVCMLFDCKWHARTSGTCVKPVGFESDPRGAKHTKERGFCKEFCSKLRKISPTPYASLPEDLKGDLMKWYELSVGVPCIASKVFYLKHGLHVTCEEIRSGTGVGRDAFRDRIKRIMKNGKGPCAGGAFYSPCDHSGPCTVQSGCRCIINKTHCEVACLCTRCRNMFGSCRCSGCAKWCPCRLANRECTALCLCRSCRNKEMQKSTGPMTFVAPSSVAGYGLFAGERIKKGSFVVEYTGEVVSNAEAERRGSFYDLRKCSYLFDLCLGDVGALYTIDGALLGNASRFINHSTDNANLKPAVLMVNGSKRIGFFATRAVAKYEELFFNYGYNEDHKRKHNILD
jgi:hypothetical protein